MMKIEFWYQGELARKFPVVSYEPGSIREMKDSLSIVTGWSLEGIEVQLPEGFMLSDDRDIEAASRWFDKLRLLDSSCCDAIDQSLL